MPMATGAPAKPSGVRFAPYWALASILLGTVLLYLPVLHTAFCADDYLFLDQVRGRSLWEALLAPDPLSNFFRPISRQVYFWVIAGLTQESPFAFRVGNLVTLLGLVTLLWALARRLAGDRAATVAAAFVALHYAADVPVRWACGSQELLSVTGALAALLLHVSGRRRWAGVAMLFAALSKEVVLLTPILAIIMDRREREPWTAPLRRAWPLGVAAIAWAACYLALPARRAGQSAQVEFDLVNNPLAALLHLLQVIPGAEWVSGAGRAGGEAFTAVLPFVLASVALVMVWRQSANSGSKASRSPLVARPVHLALIWVALAVAPITAVASLWSAYYYLFAMCGVGLLLGALLGRAPIWVVLIALGALAAGSAQARYLPGFGMGHTAWTSASHINAAYIDRSNRVTASYLASLQRAYPRLPQGSTVYFGGLAGNVAFQRGDGPLLRWAYRDTSLRSYYMYAFSKQTVRPGPMMFFLASGDTLAEMPQGEDLLLRVAFGQVLSDHLGAAREVLDAAEVRDAWSARLSYWRAWLHWAGGDTAAAHRELGRAGYGVAVGNSSVRDLVLAQLAAGDTARAVTTARLATREHPLDAAAHGLLADLLLIVDREDVDAAIEALAARVLAPDDPTGWYRWAMVQADRDRPLEAYASLQQYFVRGGGAAQGDAEAQRLAASLKAAIPAGSVDPEQRPR